MIHAIVISGSLREKSYNSSIARLIGSYLETKGVIVKVIPSGELTVPLYNSDIRLEQFSQEIYNLKKSVEESDMVVFVSPEYNHSISGVLKNAIDWLSAGEKNSLDNKVAMITGVSTGIYGTLRAQRHLRDILEALNVYILPQPEVFIGPAEKVFNDQNECVDEKVISKIYALVDKTIVFTEKLKSN